MGSSGDKDISLHPLISSPLVLLRAARLPLGEKGGEVVQGQPGVEANMTGLCVCS
jgi:hypothetical protein